MLRKNADPPPLLGKELFCPLSPEIMIGGGLPIVEILDLARVFPVGCKYGM